MAKFKMMESQDANKVRKGRKGLSWSAPGLVMTARRGLPLYLPPPLMADLEGVVAVAVPIGDLMGLSGHLGAMFSSPTMPRKAFPWTPAGAELILACVDLIDRHPENITGPVSSLKINSDRGRHILNEDQLVEVLNSGFWDSAILPAEQAPFADQSCGTKRCRRSVQENRYFMHRIEGQNPVPLIANLQGGSCKVSRQHAIDDLDHDRFEAYFIGGFETHTAKELETNNIHRNRFHALNESVRMLKPRAKTCLTGFDGTCAEVITAVMAGIDLIQIGLPSSFAKLGLQLNFQIEMPSDLENVEPLNLSLEEIELKILDMLDSNDTKAVSVTKLADRAFAQDMTQFSCLSRRVGEWQGFGSRYSKAYVHHLLNCRETLAYQLLEWHNWRLMIEWFGVMRDLFSNRKKLMEYFLWFIDTNLIKKSPEEDDNLWDYKLPESYTAY